VFDFMKMMGSDLANGADGATGNGYLGMLQGAGVPPVDRQAMLAGLMMSPGQAFANQGRMRPMQAIANAIGGVGAAGRDDPQRMAQMWQAGQQMRAQQRRNQTREWLMRNAQRLNIPPDVIDKLDDAEVARLFLERALRGSGPPADGVGVPSFVPGAQAASAPTWAPPVLAAVPALENLRRGSDSVPRYLPPMFEGFRPNR
jgi:hypothetical protein